MSKSAAAERRDEKARALGFSSYGQQYRASKRGYTDQGAEYNAAMAAERTVGPVITRRATRAGVVLSVNVTHKGAAKALFRAARREMR